MSKESSIAGNQRRNRALRKIRSANIPEEIKATLQALIDFLDHRSDYRLAWPSVATLAKRLQKCPRTVRYHLQAVRGMGIFSYEHLAPREAVEHVQKKYGFRINLERCRRQAPVLFEINSDHPLWDAAKKLPDSVVEDIRVAIEKMKGIRSKRQSTATDCRSSTATDCTQLFYKEETPLAFPSSQKASTSPLFSDENKGTAEGNPDRVYAVTTTGANSCCYAPANDGTYLPTHRHNSETENAPGSEQESHLIPQAGSGSKLSASSLFESKTQGAEGGSSGSDCYEPEERDYSSAIDFQSYEPEERDPAPTGYVFEAQKGISEVTEGIETCSVPPPAQKKEERKKEALSGHEILMRMAEERDTRRLRMVSGKVTRSSQGRQWAPVGHAASDRKEIVSTVESVGVGS